MKAIVKAHPETNKVITRAVSEKGNEYGTIRVQQTVLVTENGFLTPKNRSAFIRINGEHLDAMESLLFDGMEYPSQGTIQRVESFTPQYEGQKPKITPGKDGEPDAPYLLNGKSVYFQDNWTSNVNAKDVLLEREEEVAFADESLVSGEMQV